MGRGNVCVTGSYEGLFYIDNDDLRVYRRNDPHAKEEETSLQRDLSYEDLSGDEWLLDEVGSSYEEEDVLECFCAELRKLCPSFQPAANSNVWLGNERRVILENELFYICVEDNEWSLAVELVQKDFLPLTLYFFRRTAIPTVRTHGSPASSGRSTSGIWSA